jgi:hypothetical protein
MSTNNQFPSSFMNYRNPQKVLQDSQGNSPEGSQEDSQECSQENPPQLPEEESIMYVIYCHGEMMPNLFDNFVIPEHLDRIIHLYYIADAGYILVGGPINIPLICNANIDPRHTKRSNDIISNMKLIGGDAIGLPLGIYVCTNGSEIQGSILVFDMTNGFPPPYHTTLRDTIDKIMIHHEANYRNKGLRITMHTCRVVTKTVTSKKNTPIQKRITTMPRQNAKSFGEKDLSNLFEKNIDIGNAMDASENDNSGGKKKSKSKTVKRKKTK